MPKKEGTFLPRSVTLALLLLTSTTFFPAPAFGEVSIGAAEDSYVDSSAPSSNFGTSSRLLVDNSPTVFRTFVRFIVEGITFPVESAQMALRCVNSGPGGTVWTISESWTEGGLTWNNQPKPVDSISSPGPFSCSSSGTPVVYDLTSVVTGDGVYDLVIATTADDGVDFFSKESGSGPTLVINGQVSSGSSSVDQIHLSWTQETATTMTITWHTTSSTNPTRVQFGTTTNYGSIAGGTTYASSGTGYLHQVTLTGLQPETRYIYRVSGDDGSWSENHSFLTAPRDYGDFRFLAVADMGRNSNSITISNLMASRNAAFTVGAGDYWYSDDEDNVDEWFNINEPLMSQAPFMPARGNHEGGNHETSYPNRYPTRFALPPPENYYSFRYGASHFLIVDTNIDLKPGSSQRDFIEADLQAAAADPGVRWIFAVHHHPPFSSTTFESLTVRDELSPVYDRWGVDVVITGHAHLYERTFPVKADGTVASFEISAYENPSAPIYTVTGGGGASPNPGDIKCSSDRDAWSAKCLEVFEFLEFHVTPTSAQLTTIGKDGVVLDGFTLQKPDSEPPNPAPGEALTFAPTDDAYVRADFPRTNYGSRRTVQVDNSPVKDFLLKFSITGIGSGQVTSAKLRLFAAHPSDSGGDFYLTADTWRESTVTWGNAPASQTRIAVLGPVSSGNWYEVDLTLVVSGDGVLSLRVSSGSSNQADYSSKEGANAPQLTINLSN
jgi:predicted phosphodiesterase